MSARAGMREQYSGYPSVGAVHPVIATEPLRALLNEIANIADLTFEQPFSRYLGHEPESERLYDPAKYYRLFDAQRLGLSVFDLETSSQAAFRARAVWEKNDLGQVKKEVEHESAKCLPDNGAIKVKVDRVVSTGGKIPGNRRETIRSKLAFGLDPSAYNRQYELLFEEHDIIKNAVWRRIKNKKVYQQDPVVDFSPMIPFMAYKHCAEPDQIAQINSGIEELLREHPVTLVLGNLTTERSQLVRGAPQG